MKKFVCLRLLFVSLLASLFVELAVAQQPLSGKQSILVTVTATVQTINYETREVTLMGQLGNTISFVVDASLQRLNQHWGQNMVFTYDIPTIQGVRLK